MWWGQPGAHILVPARLLAILQLSRTTLAYPCLALMLLCVERRAYLEFAQLVCSCR